MKNSKLRYPNAKQISADIDRGNLARTYIFLGEEDGEKERFIERIAGLFIGEGESTISRFHCESGDVVAAALYTLESAMFSPKKIAVVYNISQLASKREQSMIVQMIDDIPDSSLVIFTSNENYPPKYLDAKTLEKTSPVIFWRMFESELQNYIIKRFRDAGRQIDSHAAARILSLTGRDLRKVEEAVERILAGSEGAVTERLVASVVADARVVSVFEFVDVFFKRGKNVFALLRKVLDEGESELGLIALMQREAERIESYHLMRLSGKAHEDVISELRINPRNADDFMTSANSFDAESIRRFFILLSRADYAAKSSRLSRSPLSSPLIEVITEFVR
jgi:DNA polymerase III delta subunit